MKTYETLTGRRFDLEALTAEQFEAFEKLKELFESQPYWGSFASRRQGLVQAALKKNLPRKERTRHPLALIGEDLEMRLGIAQGEIAPPDYRDLLLDRIEERYGSRYRFCKETGVSEAFLSQVLSGKREFSLSKLREVARSLGLGLALLPEAEIDELPYCSMRI